MSKTLLCISTVWPQADATAAGVRLLGLLEMFKSAGYDLHLAATSTETFSKESLESKGIRCHQIQLNDPATSNLLERLSPEIVLFDRFIAEEQFGWLVQEKLPKCLRILDTEDLHSLRKSREQAHKKGAVFSVENWKRSPITHRELASMYRSDLSLIVSNYEYTLLKTEMNFPIHLMSYLPITYEQTDQFPQASVLSFKEKQTYVFIGNGIHQPNIDAIKWLYSEIWPEILKLQPHAILQVYGAYLPKEITQLHQAKKGFQVLGKVPEVATAFQKARVNLVPLRFGAGIKGKILEGFRHGVPHVTTQIGAEGMEKPTEWPGLLAETPSQFAAAAVQLYTHSDLWHSKQQLGYQYIKTYCNASPFQEKLVESCAHMLAHLETHRNQSLQAQILRSQAFMASKYLSLWIREKNKND